MTQLIRPDLAPTSFSGPFIFPPNLSRSGMKGRWDTLGTRLTWPAIGHVFHIKILTRLSKTFRTKLQISQVFLFSVTKHGDVSQRNVFTYLTGIWLCKMRNYDLLTKRLLTVNRSAYLLYIAYGNHDSSIPASRLFHPDCLLLGLQGWKDSCSFSKQAFQQVDKAPKEYLRRYYFCLSSFVVSKTKWPHRGAQSMLECQIHY